MQPSRLAVLIAIGGLLLPTLMTPPPARASSARVRILRDISGPSPFPADECGLPKGRCSKSIGQNCSTDGDCTAPSCPTCMPGETCISEHGDEYEPDIAVNPANRRNLIAVYSQDNQINTVVSTSRDGGRHWTQVPVPGLSQCTEGTDVTAFDPRVAIGPDGIAYTSSLVNDNITYGLLVNRSTDGGLSWSDPVTVEQSVVLDGPKLTADPHLPGTAYLAWARYISVNTASTFFSRTTDGGVTWTSPAIIPITPQRGVYTNAAAIRVLPDGTLVNVFVQFGSAPTSKPGEFIPPTSVWVVRSPDHGTTWPDSMHPIRVTEDIPSIVIPSVAVGADGTLYAVWQVKDESTSSRQIQFVKSVDGGLTWSPKAPVAVETTQAFLPTVAVSPAGTVGVTYFDFRNDVLGDQELTTDLWFRHSHDGGATWSETHVAGPFDLRPPAPWPGAYPLGDYFGLAPIGRNGFGAAWVQTTTPPRTQGATDTFFARLRVSPRP